MDWACILVLMVSFIYMLIKWTNLPTTIPIHFNARGEADGWGNRVTLILLPFIALILYVGLSLLRRVPHHFNYIVPITEQNAEAQYRLSLLLISWIKLEIVILFGYISWSSIQNAVGLSSGLGIWLLPVSLAVMISTIVLAMIRMRKTG
ncbi:DUF1648 domain-containing protein [Paenibacillus sp. MCAF20]